MLVLLPASSSIFSTLIMNQTVSILRKHLKTTIFFGLYVLVWLLPVLTSSNSSRNPTSCGAGNGALYVLLMLVTFIYTVVLIVKIATSPNKKFFGIVLLFAWMVPVLCLLVTVAISGS